MTGESTCGWCDRPRDSATPGYCSHKCQRAREAEALKHRRRLAELAAASARGEDTRAIRARLLAERKS